jgi:hypothetical protein
LGSANADSQGYSHYQDEDKQGPVFPIEEGHCPIVNGFAQLPHALIALLCLFDALSENKGEDQGRDSQQGCDK